MGKNKKNNPTAVHDIDIKAINKARSILEDYRAYLCGSLLSEMETHYKMRLEAFEREMKAADREFDLNVRATRDVRVNKNTRKDRKADLASHEADLKLSQQEKKRAIQEMRESFQGEYEKLVPREWGPLHLHYKKKKISDNENIIISLFSRFEKFNENPDLVNSPLMQHLFTLYDQNNVFRMGVEKAKLLDPLIRCLAIENAHVPSDTIAAFTKQYETCKANIKAHRDSEFQRVIKMILKLFASISPVLGLTGVTKLWRSEGEKMTKKVDTILKKRTKSQERILPKTK